MSRGRIEKALSGFYYVNTGGETLQCRARGKFRREGLSPLVGDWVQVRELGNGEGFVEAVEARRNQFARPAAANIDQLVILASAAIPVTEPYLIDRIASIAALKGCQVLLCLNKCDLDSADELYDIYSRSAIPVLRVSAVTGQGLDALREAIRGKLSAFTGNSGVGKSSVLNALLPSLALPVGEVSMSRLAFTSSTSRTRYRSFSTFTSCGSMPLPSSAARWQRSITRRIELSRKVCTVS